MPSHSWWWWQGPVPATQRGQSNSALLMLSVKALRGAASTPPAQRAECEAGAVLSGDCIGALLDRRVSTAAMAPREVGPV
ncbi:hypothetical_protein_-_conserved [Leishmania infantum]|uniref:Uncharacterized protein n=2 Tax=Leishmania donovani species complex TaxID=38574 RepID=A0A3Q8IF86_LEIDO|nr:hypothetical protein LdCL_210021700 [Leishmania donovani]CAC9486526.1 hypothetical_protein_-_conserved [Leishmania infantum]AYU78628.1 hypothetical protein LdCL_210022100 [Leishmania donovani]AYU78631.1 hypothetical protein LdCL_210022400 [Leishmania donovani]CAC9486546.1 hypothetical_protein_-_conserved [Leishmania infantum]